MRIGVLRGDLPGPIFISDLETVSQTNFPVDPPGQTCYISRPTTAEVTTAMSTVPASIQSTGNITFGLVVNGSNNVLKLRAASSGAYTTVTLAQTTYANITTLLAALNTALTTAGLPIIAEQGTSNVRVRFKTTTTALGVGASIGLDTNGNGSTANASLGFAVGGGTHTVPSAATVINALNPVSGTLDVSSATQTTQVSPAITAAQVKLIADAIAPQFIETDMAVKSYLVGVLADLRNANFTPDPNRLPALTPAAAISVVQDDGVTAFSSSSLAALPTISGASISGGTLTISGSGLGNSEFENSTKVKVTNTVTGQSWVTSQRKFVASGGTVSATSVTVPTSLLGSSVAGVKVQLLFGTLASNVFTAT